MIYYTDQEMTDRMTALVDEGKSILEILNDPKCTPEFKSKMEHLAKLQQSKNQKL